MNKTLLITLLFLLFINSSLLHAYKYRDKGAYGSIDFRYIDDYYESNNSLNSQQDFIQEYKLGYMGNIYSPRLLDYTLEGLFRFERLKNETDSYPSNTKIDSQDYKINLAFIKETKYPVTIYAQQTNRPVSTIYSESINRYSQEVEKYGIMGSMKFDLLTLSYGASNNKGIYEGVNSIQNRDTNIYRISARRNEKNYNLQLSYNHLQRTTDRTDANKELTRINQTDDTVDFAYGWNISEALVFDSGLRYQKSDYYNSESTTADASLRWNPNKKYNGMVSMSAARSDTFVNPNTSENTQVYGSRVDMLNMTQMFNYNLTPELILSESMSLYTYSAESSSGSNYNIRLGANYSKQLFADTRIQLSSSVDMRTSENKTTVLTSSNNDSLNKETYIINVGARVNQSFPSIRSTLNVGAAYYTMQTSIDETRDRYSANALLFTRLFGEFSNRIDFNYMYDESSTLFGYSDELEFRTIIRTDIGEYLDYSTRLGIRGRVSMKAGVRHSEIDNEGLIVTRTIPRADMNLNYRFWQRLIFSASAHVDKDLTYNTLNYSATANLSYKIRKISFSMGYQYYKTEVTDEVTDIDNPIWIPERNRSRFEAKLSRTF